MGDCRHCGANAEGVIGEPDLAAEELAHVRDDEDVAVLRGCGVGTCAFEEGYVLASGIAGGVDHASIPI